MFRSFQKATALLKRLHRRPAGNRTRRAHLQVEALDQRLVLSAAHSMGSVLHPPEPLHPALAAKHHPVRHGHKHEKLDMPVQLPAIPVPLPEPVPVPLPQPIPIQLPPALAGDVFALSEHCSGSPYGQLTITKESLFGSFSGSFVDQGSGHSLSGAVSGQVTLIGGSHTVGLTFTFSGNAAYEFMGVVQTDDKSAHPSWRVSNLEVHGLVPDLQAAGCDHVDGREFVIPK
jgi:hypothetical protein